ncbi:MAG TPA: DUF1036 domain-containing protein [Pseudolabrys sp.]|nr:DUF1036 domain-containing protein [Pseudolabrys sp.]
MPQRCLFKIIILFGWLFGIIGAAQADFRVCNRSSQRIDVALAYPQPPFGWTSEGWWPLAVGQCTTLLRGPLSSRYYYLYATGAHGGVWKAPQDQQGGFFCTRTGRFLFRSRSLEKPRLLDCTGGGAQPRQFFKVDTGGAANHVQKLSD